MAAVNDVIAEELARRGRGARRKLAAAVGVGEDAVSRWASGKNMPTPTLWPAIEEALELEEGALSDAAAAVNRGGDEPSGIPDSVAEALRTLGAEQQMLRDELHGLRVEVTELRRAIPGSVRSSDRVPPAPLPKRKKSAP
jgi:transcriptional regulator with XRE-family HTH domain